MTAAMTGPVTELATGPITGLINGPGFRVAARHPALAGHFPGRPLVPGVMLLDAVIEAARTAGLLPGGAALQLHRVKFLRPVGPEQEVRVEFVPPTRGNRLGFTGRSGEAVLFTGELTADELTTGELAGPAASDGGV